MPKILPKTFWLTVRLICRRLIARGKREGERERADDRIVLQQLKTCLRLLCDLCARKVGRDGRACM